MSNRKRTPFILKCKAKEAPALKKYRADVLNISKATDELEKHRTLTKKDSTFSRKKKRKEERKLKKARRHAFRCGRQVYFFNSFFFRRKEKSTCTEVKH